MVTSLDVLERYISATLDEVCKSTEVVTPMGVVEAELVLSVLQLSLCWIISLEEWELEVNMSVKPFVEEVLEELLVVDEVVVEIFVVDEDEAFVQVPSLFPLHW